MVASNQNQYIMRQRNLYQEQEKKFLEGDLVWLYTNRPDPNLNRKFQSFYSGPYRIIQQVSNTLFKIEAYGNWNASPIITVVAVDRLKKCTVRDPENNLDLPINIRASDVQPYFEDTAMMGRVAMAKFAPHIFQESDFPGTLDVNMDQPVMTNRVPQLALPEELLAPLPHPPQAEDQPPREEPVPDPSEPHKWQEEVPPPLPPREQPAPPHLAPR